MDILAGCSGYRYYHPQKGWKQKYKQKLQAYADHFPIIEINSTFYSLPRVSTAEKWKKITNEVNDDFIFTVKANQRLTHPPSSPTYQKADLKVSQEKKDNYGYLQSTEEVFEAWRETKEICEALDAKVCLFQTPPSFKPTKENLTNLKDFFSKINSECALAFEPRGEAWTSKVMKDLEHSLEVVQVVDPLKENPTLESEWYYFRLHGLGAKKYKYKFSNEDLQILFKKCKEHAEKRKVYVFFNNYEMFSDCQRFLSFLRTGEIPSVSWGAKAVVKEIDVEFPTTKSKIHSKCGNWWVWITPEKTIRVKKLLKSLEKEKFTNQKELLQEIRHNTDLGGE